MQADAGAVLNAWAVIGAAAVTGIVALATHWIGIRGQREVAREAMSVGIERDIYVHARDGLETAMALMRQAVHLTLEFDHAVYSGAPITTDLRRRSEVIGEALDHCLMHAPHLGKDAVGLGEALQTAFAAAIAVNNMRERREHVPDAALAAIKTAHAALEESSGTLLAALHVARDRAKQELREKVMSAPATGRRGWRRWLKR